MPGLFSNKSSPLANIKSAQQSLDALAMYMGGEDANIPAAQSGKSWMLMQPETVSLKVSPNMKQAEQRCLSLPLALVEKGEVYDPVRCSKPLARRKIGQETSLLLSQRSISLISSAFTACCMAYSCQLT